MFPETSPGAPAPQRSALQALAHRDLVARFARSVEHIDRRVLELTDAQLDSAFHPAKNPAEDVGRWPARVLLGHLADAELVFVHRLRRVVGEDNPVFALWDENAFIDAHLYGSPETGPKHPIGAFVATIHTLRAWTREWLLTLDDDQWRRQGLHPERGPLTLRTILEYDVWHLEHHAWYLNRKVHKLLGPAPAEHAH